MSTATYLLCTIVLGALAATLFTRLVLSRGRQLELINSLSGPPPSSWLVGNLPAFIRSENAGDADSEFVEKYGLAFKMKGTFNQDIIYLADPQAIHYILNTCGYTFHKKNMAFLFRLITGPSLLAAEGEDHSRQRKILLPSLAQGVIKQLIPHFTQTAEKAAGRWRDLMQEEGNSSSVVDVYSWLSRLTLDAIGQGAFSYDFHALSDTPSEFVEAYRNVFVGMFHKPSDAELAGGVIFRYMPFWFIPIMRRLPARGMKRLTKFQATAKTVALSIVKREMQALEGGLPQGKDIMSSLVRANMSEDPKRRMGDDELLSQMMGVMLAGHDTTSASLVWVFYELSRHPEVQSRIRKEIRTTRAAAAVNLGHRDLGAAEFESMTYTIAVIKETLRYYPIAPHNSRTAGRDELIPLSKPVLAVSGEEIYAIPVKKGGNVLMSNWAYNRIKSLWGNDAAEWNPERFLGEGLADRPKNSVGVYANLATFSSGVHSCPGWRFAILEMQAVLITLVENFEFSPPSDNPNILQALAPTLIPMVKGQEDQGPQMPLTITPID